MKRIIAERIARLNAMLDNKEAKLMQNKNYASRPFMQGNIIDMREYLKRLKFNLNHSSNNPTEQRITLKGFRSELQKCEEYINALEVNR
jgi:hypothetical protein